jgi:hypothetical protein
MRAATTAWTVSGTWKKAAVDECAQHLLDEEGVPLGTLDDRVQTRWQGAAKQVRKHSPGVTRCQRLDRDGGASRADAPAGSLFEQLRASRDDQQERRPGVSDDALQEIHQQVLCPMDVLDEHDDGPLQGYLFNEPDPCVLELVAGGERMDAAGHVEPQRQAKNLSGPKPVKQGGSRIVLHDP